ncbi:putative Synaptotagmin-6, partial [Operophtera brumata]
MSGIGPPSVWAAQKRLESWARAARERTSSASSGQSHNSTDSYGDDKSHGSPHEMLIPKEQCRIQPLSMEGRAASSLPHARLTRTPSISSQSSLDSGTSRATECRIQPLSMEGRAASSLPHARLTRTPCISSQSSLDSGTSRATECRIQPLSMEGRATSSLPHARLTRTPSISSQSSLDSGTSRNTSHRGSSPAIRTFAPDGRTLEAGAGMPRSPSPLRAASLDVRAAPLMHGSLASLSDSQTPSSPRHLPPRCLSPLLVPPRRIDRSNSLVESSSGVGPLSPGASAAAISALGALQPDLYTKREAPLVIELEGAGPSLGRIHLRMKYDFDRSDLEVHLIEGKVDARVRQTPVHRNEANPFFNHHFKFPVSHDELADKILLLQVFDYDRFSRNEVMGSAKVPLSKVEVAGGAEVWAALSRERRPPEELQELLLSLSYLPSAERLTVVVLKARNLLPPQEGKEPLGNVSRAAPARRAAGGAAVPLVPAVRRAAHLGDVFVKVYLLVNGKRVKKKKTNRKELNSPVWNEALSFSLPSANLQEASIEVCVVSGGSNALVIGWCCVGAAEPAAEGRHWAQMAHETRKAVAMWHTL